MISVVSTAIIEKDDKFLFVKETKPSAVGKWGLPGGKLEEGESITDCVRREVMEETGYHVTSENLLGIINKTATHEGNTVIRFFYSCRISSTQASTAEHESKFLSIDDVRVLNGKGLIRGDEILRLLEAAINHSILEPFLQVIN